MNKIIMKYLYFLINAQCEPSQLVAAEGLQLPMQPLKGNTEI